MNLSDKSVIRLAGEKKVLVETLDDVKAYIERIKNSTGDRASVNTCRVVAHDLTKIIEKKREP